MTFPVFSCLTVEPAHVSEAYFHPCKPLCGPSLQDHPALPIPALWLWSHLLNQVSHLSQAMGKLKYTLFYMGFVLKKKKKHWWKQQCVENSASKCGHRGMVLPLKMLTKVHCGPRSSSHTCLQSCWVPASSTARWVAWSQRKHLHQDKVDKAGISLITAPSSGTDDTGLCVWSRFRTCPSHSL